MSDVNGNALVGCLGETPSASKERIAQRRPARVIKRRSGAIGPLLAAGPAVIGLGLSAALLPVLRSQSVTDRYDREALSALLARDYPTAQVCFQRLLHESPGNQNYRSGLALAENGIAEMAAQADRTGSPTQRIVEP